MGEYRNNLLESSQKSSSKNAAKERLAKVMTNSNAIDKTLGE